MTTLWPYLAAALAGALALLSGWLWKLKRKAEQTAAAEVQARLAETARRVASEQDAADLRDAAAQLSAQLASAQSATRQAQNAAEAAREPLDDLAHAASVALAACFPGQPSTGAVTPTSVPPGRPGVPAGGSGS